jgi:uncharacterized phage protein gp47/JayE
LSDPTYADILALMQERYRELAGFEADDASDIGIRLKVVAQEVSGLYAHCAEMRRQAFAQTSTGAYLDMHAETRGLARKEAIPAKGILRFTRAIPTSSDIHIDAGVICATRPDLPVRFETTEPAVLAAGQTQVDIPAVAVDAGRCGNVATGSVCLMITPAVGITGVGNPSPFSGGVDGEDDTALRERLLESYRNISNSANSAFYYDKAMGFTGVESAAVIPRARGRGTVDVVIHPARTVDAGAVATGLQRKLSAEKEINVDVLVRAATVRTQAVTAEISVEEGSGFDAVSGACQKAVEAHIEGLAVGERMLLARLGAAILAVDGVYNYKLTGLQGDVIPAPDEVIRPGAVGLGRIA